MIGEEVWLNGPLGEVEAFLTRARAEGGHTRLGLLDSQKIVALMNYERGNDPWNQVTRVYWSVSDVAIQGVLETVRTTLVGLVAEMRAAMPDTAATPTSEAADHAVNVVIHGNARNVNFTTAQASPESQATANAPPAKRPWWRGLWGLLVGAATIIAAAVAVAAWQGWGV